MIQEIVLIDFRVWILLEYKKWAFDVMSRIDDNNTYRIPYQYVEVDPYNKPKALLDINPRGLVPVSNQWEFDQVTQSTDSLHRL